MVKDSEAAETQALETCTLRDFANDSDAKDSMKPYRAMVGQLKMIISTLTESSVRLIIWGLSKGMKSQKFLNNV